MDNTQEPKALTDLPLELLRTVVEHLSPVDFACLALCNRLLMFYFAGSAFQPTANERLGGSQDKTRIRTRIDFLTRLSRALPPYYLCHNCQRLHLWQRIAVPSPNFELPSCSQTLAGKDCPLKARLCYSLYPCYDLHRFHFVHLQLAMRRFYYGPHFGIPTESLFYTEAGTQVLGGPAALWIGSVPNSIQELHRNYMTTLKSFEARICSTPPSLILRIQELAVARRQNIPRIFPVPMTSFMRICHHIGSGDSVFFASESNPADFDKFLISFIEQYRADATLKHLVHQRQRCEECNTSWKLEIRDLGRKDVCLVSTRWIDLGPGLSPQDARWRIHDRYAPYMVLAEHQLVENPRIRFEKDSTQANGPDSLSEAALYRRNVALLKDQRYQTVMAKASPQTWFLLAGEAKKQEHGLCIAM